jgi:UDP-N-acetyl-D-galactosamine dehydrogenase
MRQLADVKIAIIGLGYVGLPLAIEFGRKYDVLGFDIDRKRIEELENGFDKTLEATEDQIKQAVKLSFSSDDNRLAQANLFIVTVPTPIDVFKRPDLTPLLKATRFISKYLKEGDIVIYESTVYPGATEDDCVPILEEVSGLVFNKDFFVGYSPERINPGDKEHTLTSIKKVTSGSTPEAASLIDSLYNEIITAGTHKAPSIKVAEAAKVIENTQRDLNIALINELAMIFNLMGIDTNSVLDAACTKWNFLNFRPGLVGGHCIGVDPYYLTHKAISLGYHPEVILAGRKLNDNMGKYVANLFLQKMAEKGISIPNSKVLILGITFKENCPDIRNTRVIDIISELKKYHLDVDIFDPAANSEEVKAEYGLQLVDKIEPDTYDGILVAVKHKEFSDMGSAKIRTYGTANHILFDLKKMFELSEVDMCL